MDKATTKAAHRLRTTTPPCVPTTTIATRQEPRTKVYVCPYDHDDDYDIPAYQGE